MAEFTGPDYKTLQPSGEHGNARVAIFNYETAGETAGSIYKLGVLPGSARVYRVTLQHDDLGTGNTVDLGYRYLNSADGTSDPDYWFAAQDTATAAAKVTSAAFAVTLAVGDGAEVLLTGNTAALTGTVQVIVEYDWIGQ